MHEFTLVWIAGVYNLSLYPNLLQDVSKHVCTTDVVSIECMHVYSYRMAYARPCALYVTAT